MFYIFFKMIRAFKVLDTTMSKRLQRLQVQFFRALTIQLFLPMFTAFLPVGMLYICPLFEIEIKILSNIIVILFSSHILLDAWVTLLVIRDYRTAVSRILRNFCKKPIFRNNQVRSNSSGLVNKSDLTTPAQGSSLQ